MKFLMILGLLLTALWMTGCDIVGDNKPNVSRETLERIQAAPHDLPPSMGAWLVGFPDSVLHGSTAGDTLQNN